jgi:lactose/L-arabinose transport system permease protein
MSSPSSSLTRIISRAPLYLFLSAMAFMSIFPFYWMIVGATNTSSQIINGKMTFGTALGANITTFLAQVDLAQVLWNSVKISSISTVLTMAVCSAAGYGFEMFRSKAREFIYRIVLLTLMVPFAALMIPLFILMKDLHLIGTHTAVIVPFIASAFMIFYFRQSAKAFPPELRDAAKVDGLKEWQIFLYIYVPVMRSTYAAAFIIIFMTSWNNYFWPLIVLQTNDAKTITLVVSTLVSAYFPDFGNVMVATVIATIPTVVVFFAMQRRFVQGMLGSVK